MWSWKGHDITVYVSIRHFLTSHRNYKVLVWFFCGDELHFQCENPKSWHPELKPYMEIGWQPSFCDITWICLKNVMTPPAIWYLSHWFDLTPSWSTAHWHFWCITAEQPHKSQCNTLLTYDSRTNLCITNLHQSVLTFEPWGNTNQQNLAKLNLRLSQK